MHVPSTPGPYQARPKPQGPPPGYCCWHAADAAMLMTLERVPNLRYHWVAFYKYDELEGEVQGTIRATKVDVM